jgi:hypothetical protein
MLLLHGKHPKSPKWFDGLFNDAPPNNAGRYQKERNHTHSYHSPADPRRKIWQFTSKAANFIILF